MGSYAECWVGNLHVASSKSDVDPAIMRLFRAPDRVVRRSTDSNLPRQIAKHWSRHDGSQADVLDVVYYEAPVVVVRSRLELAGYTIANARRLFEEWRVFELQRQEEWDWDTPNFAAELQRLRDLTVDQWISGIRRINDESLTSVHQKEHDGTLLGDMLKSPGMTDGWYGYEGPDQLVGLRLAIDACPEAEMVIYDLTDLVPEYIRKNEDPIQRVIDTSAAEYHSIGRTIVLTEGRSDAWILEESMRLLYPHLLGYFSFMEFADFRVGGGAGQLANLVRAFAAAGIVNRVIAVFDNDAAGAVAVTTLRRAVLPRHIVPMLLPNLPDLRSYPTLGPTGPSAMDINGMAASIELYLGHDVLRDDRGDLPSIQWTGFEASIRTYQGELLSKMDVQARFKDKLSRAQLDRQFTDAADWSGLRIILEAIFSTFHELDGELLSLQWREYYEDRAEG